MSEIQPDRGQEQSAETGPERVEGPAQQDQLSTAYVPGINVDAERQLQVAPPTEMSALLDGDPAPAPAAEREPFTPHTPSSSETVLESAQLERVATGQTELNYGDIEGLTRENVDALNALLEQQGTGPEADQNRRTILRSLERIADPDQELARSELNEPGHRAELLNSLVTEITQSAETHQGIAASCVATTFAIRMQREDPAEYARIVAGLSVDGQVTMQGGDTMTLYQGGAFIPDRSRSPFDARSISASVFQNSAMNFVSQHRDPGSSYDNETGMTTGPGGRYVGMYQDQGQYLHNQLFGTGSHRIDTSNGRGSTSPAELTNQIAASLPDQPGGVPVELTWATNGAHVNHEVLVTRIEGDRVYLRNPHQTDDGMGPEQHQAENGEVWISRSEFEARLQSAIIADPDRHPDEIESVSPGDAPTVYIPIEQQMVEVEAAQVYPGMVYESSDPSLSRRAEEEAQTQTKKQDVEDGWKVQRRKDDLYEEIDTVGERRENREDTEEEGSIPFVDPLKTS